MQTEIQGLEGMKRKVTDALQEYHQYLLDDNIACAEEKEFAYAQQRMVQVQEFYPKMIEICKILGSLTPFKE